MKYDKNVKYIKKLDLKTQFIKLLHVNYWLYSILMLESNKSVDLMLIFTVFALTCEI